MTTTLNKVIKYCKEQRLLDINDCVLVGLSGGADSVCLLFMLLEIAKEMKLGVYAFHLHHGIRGEEADRDASFCRELCERLKVPLKTIYADVPALAKEKGLGLEEAGRLIRYEKMEKAAEEFGCNRIAVAHHMNDRAETVIFQMLRGSKLRGLTGIRPQNGKIIRPLLCLTRKEIEDTLAEMKQEYVTDSTNLSEDYSRNYIRNRLLPEMTSLREKSCEHIAETAEYIGRVEDYLEKQTEELKTKCAVFSEGNGNRKVLIDIAALSEADRLLAERAVYDSICYVAGRKKDITGEFVDMVLALLEKQSGKQVSLKYNVVARRTYDKLIIGSDEVQNFIDNNKVNCNNEFRRETVKVERNRALSFITEHGGFPKDNQSKYFDLDKILNSYDGKKEEDIVLRKAQKDDFIALYADGRGKKVFEVLKDERIDAKLRDEAYIIAVGNEALLIKGVRGSEKYRVDDNTETIIYLSFLSEV